MRVVPYHQATLSGSRASSEADMRGGAGEYGRNHPEEGIIRAMTSVLFRKRIAERFSPRFAQGGAHQGGRARVPSLVSAGC